MIEIKNVTKKFDNFVAIEDISFNVEPTSIYGLIGYNGAGAGHSRRAEFPNP